MIYASPYVMLLMRANPLRGQVERGLGPGNQDLFGPVKWHRTIRRGPFYLGPKKFEISRAHSPPICPSNWFALIKSITYRVVSIKGSFMYMSFHRTAPPPSNHLYTALYSGQCGKLKLQNLLEINRKL